jgi:hypothetical protein
MRRPDFFIVGAPKCGTTALYEYLKQHPEVFMPGEAKEPTFFGSDFNSEFFIRDETKYLSLFSAARHEKRIGEASVWYLYSKLAAREIKAFAPAAKIIIMLRDPVEVIHSLHSQLLYSGYEDLEDFEEALGAEAERRRGLRLPRFPQLVEALYYREVVKYAEQVQRYFFVFDRAQIKVIIYDDLKRDTGQIFRETCSFLDVDPQVRVPFRVFNSHKRVRSRTLRDFTRRPPGIAPRWAKKLIPLDVRKRLMWSLVKAVLRFNTKYEERPPLPAELRSRLQVEFAPEVDRLSKLLGRDLSHWSSSR